MFKITSHVDKMMKALDEQAEEGLRECGEYAVGKAKGYCPVDTGKLRDSITSEVADNACYIGTDIEYGKNVEFGTRRQRAQPYLRRLRDGEHVEAYKRILEDALKG